MGRRRQSVFEDLIDLAAMLPWWAGTGLAVASYFGFHAVATMGIGPAPVGAKGIGDYAVRQLWITFASFLQWLIPFAFLIGVVISAYKRARRERLHAQVAAAPSRGALESMGWREFEQLVGETFRRRGFRVVARGGSVPDGGVDLELHLDGDKYFVQCKQWKSRNVGVAVVRELYGVMAAEGAVGGFVVASGDFTDEARRFAEGRAIELVATENLLGMINAAAPQGEQTAATSVSSIPVTKCPLCSADMALRVARKGANAGQTFWGCSRYPQCRGTRSA